MCKKIQKHAILFLVLMALLSVQITGTVCKIQSGSNPSLANFRNVRAGSIGKNNLYRSAHPAYGVTRSPYVNSLVEANGIRTVLNLSNSGYQLQKMFLQLEIPADYYYRSLYDQKHVYTANLNLNFYNASYRRKVAAGIRFFATHKGPYLVHCEIGRDRTGLVMLLLESLMGAPYSYILDDNLQSDMNLSGYSYEKARRKATSRLGKHLQFITGKNASTDWSKVNLSFYAADYLKKGGMTPLEIATLKKNLSTSYPDPVQEDPPAMPRTEDFPLPGTELGAVLLQ